MTAADLNLGEIQNIADACRSQMAKDPCKLHGGEQLSAKLIGHRSFLHADAKLKTRRQRVVSTSYFRYNAMLSASTTKPLQVLPSMTARTLVDLLPLYSLVAMEDFQPLFISMGNISCIK